MPTSQRDLKHPIHASDHSLGAIDAKVRILIYADFVAPQIIDLHQTLMTIYDSVSDTVLLAYRQFPQTSHRMSFAVAQALEAAGQQGKFWQMLEQILLHQDNLTDGTLRQHARTIGLNLAQFEDDVANILLTKRIQNQIERASSSSVHHAPAIFVNGMRQDTISEKQILSLIEHLSG